MAPTNVPDDFKEFLRLLNGKGARYLVVGGYAVNHYGYVRPTLDLDIWIAADPPNADLVVEALREFGFDVPNLNRQILLKPDGIVRLGYPPLRIEIMPEIDGVSFDECYAARQEPVVDGVKMPVIGLADLRRNKRASGRLKDLADLEVLPEPKER